MELDKKLKILRIMKGVLLFLACVYLVVWLLYAFFPKYYIALKLERYLGFLSFLPAIFDKIITNKFAISDDRAVPMGYMWVGLFCLILRRCCNNFIKRLERRRIEEEEEEIKRKFIKETKVKKEKEKDREKEAQYKEGIFGLLELDFEYLDNFQKDNNELKVLRLEYYKILSEKLKTKYRGINFTIRNKLFFTFDDYSILSSITKDILKILNLFISEDKYNKIRTITKFAYWLDYTTANNKMGIFRALSQINELGNPNKIIISNDLYLKIKSAEVRPWCKAEPIGTYTLFRVYDNQSTEVDLLKLTSIR